LGRPPDRSGQETRRELLEAALELFSRHGYAGTSVREIAQSVGIRDSAIYGHFPSKQALYDEAMRGAEARLLDLEALDLQDLGERSPDEALRELVVGLLRSWSRPEATQFIGALIREGLEGGPKLLANAVSRLAPVFAEWVGRKALRSDVPADALAWEFLAPLFMLRVLYFQGNVKPEARRKARALALRHLEYFLSTTRP
jgi:AcrR family transcriptional regulator